MKKLNKKTNHLLTLFIVFLFLALAYASGSEDNSSLDEPTVKFEQVGYYKGNNKLRYFTFYINSTEELLTDSIQADVFDAIKQHGANRMNTSGQVTASFYYINKESVPDITNLSADQANKLAHQRKPIASVWIMPSGEINLIKNPQ
jgi:hypothetical protein